MNWPTNVPPDMMHITLPTPDGFSFYGRLIATHQDACATRLSDAYSRHTLYETSDSSYVLVSVDFKHGIPTPAYRCIASIIELVDLFGGSVQGLDFCRSAGASNELIDERLARIRKTTLQTANSGDQYYHNNTPPEHR